MGNFPYAKLPPMWFGLSKITPVGPMFAGKPPYQIQVFYNLVLCPWVLGTNSNSPCLLDKWGNGGRETSLTFVGTTASLVHDCMKARDRLNAENLNLLVSSGFAKFAILWWDSNLHPVRRVRHCCAVVSIEMSLLLALLIASTCWSSISTLFK